MKFVLQLFVVFLFLGFNPRFSDRDSWSDFRFSITFRSFIGIRRFKRLEFCLETLYPFNQLKQVFATVKNCLRSRLVERSCFLSPFDFRCFIRFDSFCKPEFLSWTFWLDLLFEFYPCIRWVLIVCLFVCDRVPGVRRLLLRITRFPGSSARQVTLWSCFHSTQFYCIRSILTHCMIRI